jgi:hypothetical protein
MALEAGAKPSHNPEKWDIWEIRNTDFERFAALVAAHEREKVAKWMVERSYATGHGDTIEDLLKELEWEAAEREREACAKVCEDSVEYAADELARQIRARGEK